MFLCSFFFQAEDGIRDGHVTGVQTCALPIFAYFYLVDLLMDALQIRMWDDWTVIGVNQLLLLPVMFYSLYMNIIFQGQTVRSEERRVGKECRAGWAADT